MNVFEKLEEWRCNTNADVTWSIAGPNKKLPGVRYQITLYKYYSQYGRFLNEASKAGDTLEEAYEAAMKLWNERVTRKEIVL